MSNPTDTWKCFRCGRTVYVNEPPHECYRGMTARVMPTYDPKLGLEIPDDIIDAAATLEAYFKVRNIKEWKLLGVQNRINITSTYPVAPAPTYTQEQVRAMLDDISVDAERFGLEVVDHMNGHLGLRAIEGLKK